MDISSSTIGRFDSARDHADQSHSPVYLRSSAFSESYWSLAERVVNGTPMSFKGFKGILRLSRTSFNISLTDIDIPHYLAYALSNST